MIVLLINGMKILAILITALLPERSMLTSSELILICTFDTVSFGASWSESLAFWVLKSISKSIPIFVMLISAFPATEIIYLNSKSASIPIAIPADLSSSPLPVSLKVNLVFVRSGSPSLTSAFVNLPP